MFKKLEKPDEVFRTETGAVKVPTVTLETEFGYRCQIALDDRCWVVYKNSDRGYKPSPWISWDIFEELKKLPSPR